MRTPRAGEQFQGKYTVLGSLGSGGFADVLHARDVEIGREVAIKLLRPGAQHTSARRFMREARFIAQLTGPHALRLFDYGETDDGQLFMVFEHVRGTTLEALLASGPLDVTRAEHILRQLLHAVREAHELGILHRDIKPTNVLVFDHLDDRDRVKLIDFGVASFLDGARRADLSKLTAEGSIVGTPRYLAPEAFYDEPLTPAADIYSLGLVAYEMVAGRPAVAGSSPEQVLRSQLSPTPLELPDVPGAEHFCDVVRRMTARAPGSRFATADLVLDALDGAARRRAPPPPIRTPASSRPEPSRRVKPRAVLGAVGTAAGVIAAIALFTLERQRDPEVVIPQRLVRTANPLAAAPPRDPTADVRADEGAAARDRACNANPGLHRRTSVEGLAHREYFVYAPRDIDGPRPLVFVLHKLFGEGREFVGETRLHETSDREGFLIASVKLPREDAIDQTVSIFDEIYDAVRRDYCVDESRVYLLAHAAGARAARELQCERPFSALATTSDGHYPGEEICVPDPPVPHLRIYGRDDPHLPLDGSLSCTGKRMQTPESVAAVWLERNRCRDETSTWKQTPTGRCRLYACDVPFIECDVAGGFDWPHAPEPLELPGCKSPPMDFLIRDTVWEFFVQHGVPISTPE